jgi:hypothetical protein
MQAQGELRGIRLIRESARAGGKQQRAMTKWHSSHEVQGTAQPPPLSPPKPSSFLELELTTSAGSSERRQGSFSGPTPQMTRVRRPLESIAHLLRPENGVHSPSGSRQLKNLDTADHFHMFHLRVKLSN